MTRTTNLSPLPLLLALSACSSELSEARAAFREGRLPQAAQSLRALEARAAHFGPKDRARYALYRGLTHLGLGDAALAERFLGEAYWLEARHPGVLDRAEHGALSAARRSMGHPPGVTLR